MITNWRLVILGGGLGLPLVGLGFFLAAIVGEQVRFDQHPAAILGLYDEAGRQWYSPLPAGGEGTDSVWTTHLQRVDEALAQKHISAAVQAWREAYVGAMRSRGWEGLVEVADAYLRIGEMRGVRGAHEARARRTYLAALSRARLQGSLTGVRRMAQAFATLGDHEAADQCARLAERLAAQAQNGRAHEQVGAFKALFTTTM